MNRPILKLPVKVKTLAQQSADFTSEGTPPPGLAATSLDRPAGLATPAPPRPAARRAVRGAPYSSFVTQPFKP